MEGKKVWVGKEKILMDGKWWYWNEIEEKLKDGEGLDRNKVKKPNIKVGEGIEGREKKESRENRER